MLVRVPPSHRTRSRLSSTLLRTCSAAHGTRGEEDRVAMPGLWGRGPISVIAVSANPVRPSVSSPRRPQPPIGLILLFC